MTVANVLDFGQPIGDRPVPALAAQLLGAAPGEEAGARRAVLEGALDTGILEPTDALAAADLLAIEPVGPSASLLAAVDAATRERERSRILRQILARQAAMRPVLVIVEDVHWADASEIAQLGDLAGAVATLPVMLALSTRPDGDPFTANWRARARGCPVTLLDLAPLADDEARELAARHGALPPEVLEHCLETAAGNPLFLVQLLRSAEAGQSALPGSIRALLLARVERLPAAAQALLHAAAILGNRFALEALRHVAAAPVTGPADLEAPGLLACDGEECRFTHALVREAVYESLLRSTRRSLHGRAALWFETRDPSLHAEHLAAAEDPAAAAAHLAGGDARAARRPVRPRPVARRACARAGRLGCRTLRGPRGAGRVPPRPRAHGRGCPGLRDERNARGRTRSAGPGPPRTRDGAAHPGPIRRGAGGAGGRRARRERRGRAAPAGPCLDAARKPVLPARRHGALPARAPAGPRARAGLGFGRGRRAGTRWTQRRRVPTWPHAHGPRARPSMPRDQRAARTRRAAARVPAHGRGDT